MNLSFGKCNGNAGKGNGELEKGMRGMMGMRGIRVGMMGMQGIMVGMRGIEVGIIFQIDL